MHERTFDQEAYVPTNPSIIDCGGIVFITTPFPPGPVTKLVPSWTQQNEIGVEADLRYVHDNEYFIVTLSSHTKAGSPDPTPEEWNEIVREVIQFVWNEMDERELVSGPMPEIIRGDPLKMAVVTVR